MQIENGEALKALLARGERLRDVEITPALATEILETMNLKNRGGSTAHVGRLARALSSGKWNRELGGTVAFYADQNLADGGHRLRAIVKAGVGITVDVIPGITSVLGQDEGFARSVADYLQMRRVNDYRTVAHVLKGIYRHADEGAGTPGVSDYLEFYGNPDVEAFVNQCVTKSAEWLDDVPKPKQVLRHATLALCRAVAVRVNNVPADTVDQYLSDLVHGGPTHKQIEKLYDALEAKSEKALGQAGRMREVLSQVEAFAAGRNVRPFFKGKAKKQQVAA
jgi:hypothetical protein